MNIFVEKYKMNSKSTFFEIALITTLAIGLVLKNYDIKVDYLLYANLVLINIFWIFQNTIFNTKIRKAIIIEKEIISITLWALVMNLCKVRASEVLFTISLLILALLYLVKFIKYYKTTDNWLSKQEPLILSIIILSFFLQFMHYPYSGILRFLSFSYYSIAMIIFGFKNNLKTNKTEHTFLKKLILLSSISISILLVSILFRTLDWHYSRTVYRIGFLLTIISSYYLFLEYKKDNNKNTIISQIIKRMYVVILITMVLFSYLMVNYLRLDYGNRPELIESYIDYKFNNHLDKNSASYKKFKKLHNDYRNNKIPEAND